MRKYFSILILCLFPVVAFAQSITGKVKDENGNALAGANVHWLGYKVGATANQEGLFELKLPQQPENRLVISFIGFRSDTVQVNQSTGVIEIMLVPDGALNEVVIQGSRPGMFISDKNPIKTEVITQTELKKAACCDLAGCFDTQASVQPQTTNVITNSKELRLLGLSGVYNQILIDGMPMIQGLTYTYGISSIPGTLVDRIYVSKGANSVLQGYESISGQINVETKEADNSEKLLLNGYVNSFLEKHLNANVSTKKNRWSNLTTFHTVQPAEKVDRDDDNFLDLPLLTRYMVQNKLKYGLDGDWGWSSRVSVRYLHERRVGGQTFFDSEDDKGTTNAYGQLVQIQQPEVWTKTSYRVDDNHRYTLISSALHHQQNSWFGITRYKANQTNFYTNLQYELSYGDESNLKAGISFRYFTIDENVSFAENDLGRTYAGRYSRTEYIPGFFTENTWNLFGDKLTWITGFRADHHNQFAWKLTPRTLIKYQFNKNSTLRASAGTGWRTVNLFSENIGLLVSSRDIVFKESLKPERAVNLGVNFTQRFEKGQMWGFLSLDYYHTTFQNQIFPDYDTNPGQAIIKNFTGSSVSDGIQAELYFNLFNSLEIKAAYNYLGVYRNIGELKISLPFNPKDKVLATISYKPESKKWQTDVNIHFYGVQRLPDTSANPEEFQRAGFSKPYAVFNFQITKNWKKLDVYAGCENLFDFRQKKPIISWENPFGPYFDTSGVWGPTRGREIYAGVRFKILRDED